MNRRAIPYALASAALFGVSTPAAKALLGVVEPLILAGILYCGAGIGLALLRVLPPRGGAVRNEAPLGRAELPWLAGAIAAGGVVGPALLMIGLSRTPATTASLLLALEGAATALMAWFLFHESFDRRIATGMLCLVAGALLLSWGGEPSLAGFAGPLAIVGACIAWGFDNNLTRKVSLSDPLQIAEIKGLSAGPINLLLGFLAGGMLPGLSATLVAGIVGFLGYGISLALFVLALRDLGAARTAAYFSTAPFLGAAAAVVAFGEPVTWQLAVAAALMGFGVWLHATERHHHEHEHQPIEHAHPHVHDEHHSHAHRPGDPAGEPHTHRHAHARLRHRHAHMPDMHHLHRH
jgi:drug/metabolite transporter (DMT)-like permease